MKIYQLTNITHEQMMGYVIQSDNGAVIVIDGGSYNQSDELYKILKLVGGRVDMWFVSHPHSDHFASLIELLEKHNDIDVKGIWHSSTNIEEKNISEEEAEEIRKWENFTRKTYITVNELKEGDIFRTDDITIEVLGISNPEIKENSVNNQSVVLRITDAEFSIIFLADLGEEGGEKLLMKYGDHLKSTAVQMAHHGQNGVKLDVYKKIMPKFAFWPTPIWLWEGRWPNSKELAKELKTLTVRGWMENLNTVNITSFKQTVVFDTKKLYQEFIET